MDPFTLLRHPLLAFQNFRNRSQLIQYCNDHGYEQRFGHKLTYYRLTRHPNEVQQFLNELQEEMDFQRFASAVEVEAPTQRPHHERQEQYDTNNWLSTVEVQAPTQRPHHERQEEYDTNNWMSTVEVEESTQRPHNERELHHNIVAELNGLADTIQSGTYFKKDSAEYERKLEL